MANSKSEIQTIEQLNDRFQKLDKEKTRVQTLLGSAKQDLQELMAKAEREFGTKNLDELEAMLKQLESENLKMREQYQKELDAIESELENISHSHDDGQGNH